MNDLVRRGRMLAARVSERYARLSPRERALVLLTSAAVLGFGWDAAVNRPLGDARVQAERRLDVLRGELASARAASQRLRGGHDSNDLRALRDLVQRRQAEIGQLDGQLKARVGGFVSPDQAERMLADVLAHHPGMSLVSAQVLPAEAIAVDAGGPNKGVVSPGASQASGLYRHGMRLELQGSYLEALAYLTELEKLPWGLAWDRVEYQVTTHPKGRLVVELHTISNQKEWLGA